MSNKEREYFEGFKKNTISEAELNEGKAKANKLGNLAEEFLIIIELVRDAISGVYKISPISLVSLISAIVYVVMPIDAVLDVVPFIGWLDDIAVVTGVLNTFREVIEDYKIWRNCRNA